MKTEGGAYLKSIETDFHLNKTELEKEWRTSTELPHLNPELSLKLLHKLIILNIHSIKQISLPNGTNLMSSKEFNKYYKNPTKLEISALNIAAQLFCQSPCNQNCPTPCPIHIHTRTLKTQYISDHRELHPRLIEGSLHPIPPQQPQYPNPPTKIINNPSKFPIHTIISHSHKKTKDKYKITKNYDTYLCQWILSDHTIYNKWIPQRELFPYNLPLVIKHNITLLQDYYTKHRHSYYKNILDAYFTPIQNRDTRFIPPPEIIPHTQITITECNPENDIITTKNTIQTQNEVTHLFEDTGRYLTTIPTTRLKWLWQQYHKNAANIHNLIPSIQSFETKIIMLYQRYNIKIHTKNPQKNTHYNIPINILDTLITTLNISQSYFSSPLTCPTQIIQFYSLYTRDKIFGSFGTAFQYKWKGIGYAHPHNEETTHQAIHWARLAAKHDPTTATIIVIPDKDWYHNKTPYEGPFPDTHVIAHFAADTITYDKPNTPQNSPNPRIEPLAIHILCIHHQNHNFGTTSQIDTIKSIINNMQIPQYYIQKTPPTPPNTIVNKSNKWKNTLYPPYRNLTNILIPTLPTFEINPILKFPPQYCYYTDGSFIPPKKAKDGHWKKEKAGYGIYHPTKPQIQISKRLPGLQTIFRAELMAIHKTLKIITTKYPHEPAHIFTDCLNCLYVINTQIKHPTHHNNHADKTILTDMVKMLKTRTQPTTIYKFKAHINIQGNEQADILAKNGIKK